MLGQRWSLVVAAGLLAGGCSANSRDSIEFDPNYDGSVANPSDAGRPDGGTIGHPDASYPPTVVQTATSLSQAVCDKVWNCCTASDLASTGEVYGTDLASCKAKFTALLEETAPDLKRAHLDTAAESQCLNALNGELCHELASGRPPSGGEACNRLWVGTQQLHQPCGHGDECVSALCIGMQFGSDGTITGDGTCATPAGSGQPCADGAGGSSSGLPCQTGLVRKYDTSGHCTCQSPAGFGASCTSSSECASYYCSHPDAGMPTCGNAPASTICTRAP